jgi:hypothetical protein
MKCDFCGKDWPIWILYPVRDIPRRIQEYKMRKLLQIKNLGIVDTDKPYQKCCHCYGWPITITMQKVYNIDKDGNYLGDEKCQT